jgi:hypothetical protein
LLSYVAIGSLKALRTGPFKYPDSNCLGPPAGEYARAGEMIPGEHACGPIVVSLG